MTRLARLSTTLTLVALSLCLWLIPMADGPVLTLAIVLAAVGTAVLVAMVIDTFRPIDRIAARLTHKPKGQLTWK